MPGVFDRTLTAFRDVFPLQSSVPTLRVAALSFGGAYLALEFKLAVTGNTVPALTASGGAVTATYLSGSGAKRIFFTLSREIATDETVTIDLVAGAYEAGVISNAAVDDYLVGWQLGANGGLGYGIDLLRPLLSDLYSNLLLGTGSGGSLPINVVPPTLPDEILVGDVLTVSPGHYFNTVAQFRYTWYRYPEGGDIGDKEVIPGETTDSYTLVEDDDGYIIFVVEKAVGLAGGTTLATSNGATGVSVTYPILLENGLPLLLENGQPLELQNGGIGLTITAPFAYQVFQRDSSNEADIAITGTCVGDGAVQARWNGGSWTTIDAAPVAGTFAGILTNQSSGQGRLEVRFANDITTTAYVDYIGVGEVFGCLGQSNMSGRGNVNYIQYHPTLVAGLFGNDYAWKRLADPYDSGTGQVDAVSNDSTQAKGSFVVPLSTLLMTTLGCPVAFVPCALGATSITSWTPTANHLDRTKLYGSANYRIQQVGGARCVLWWQGETDALAAMAEATYNGHLDTLANAIGTDLGIKLMPCKLQNSSGITDADELKINDAIGTAWSDNANVATGPDFSAYGSDDDYHFVTEENLLIAAQGWHDAIIAEFFP